MKSITPTIVFLQAVATAHKYKIHCLRGGARSSKSYSLMQMAYTWLMTGEIGKIHKYSGTFAIVRDTLPALKATVLKDFIDYLVLMGDYAKVIHKITTNQFQFKQRTVSFWPTTDSKRLKGRQNDFIWINEANGITWLEWNDLFVRCGSQIWLDYNPDSPDSWVRHEIEERRRERKGDVNLMVSTIKMNPFLSDSQREAIEDLYYVDRELYEILTLGRWVTLKGLIFPNFEIIPEKDFPNNTLKQCYGLDFGYNDPTALMHLAYIKEDYDQVVKIDGKKVKIHYSKGLYINEKIYESGMLTTDIIREMGTQAIKNDRIIADSADPKAIQEIKKAGFRCKACKKGADSIRKGIDTVKGLKIKVTDNSLNTLKELKRYKWKVDKNGNTLNEPIDKYNHSADAIRYGAEYLTKTNTLKIL